MGRRPDADRTEEMKAWNASAGKYKAVLKYRYGISPEQYDEMLRRQDGACALCLESCNTGQRLSIDHDHETGRVRGLLCRRCNTALSREEKHPGWLDRAASYLKGGDANVHA